MGIAVQRDDGFRHHIDLPLQAVPAIGIEQVHARLAHHADIRLDQDQFGVIRSFGLVDASADAEHLDLGAQHPKFRIPLVEGVIAPVGETGPHRIQVVGQQQGGGHEHGHKQQR